MDVFIYVGKIKSLWFIIKRFKTARSSHKDYNSVIKFESILDLVVALDAIWPARAHTVGMDKQAMFTCCRFVHIVFCFIVMLEDLSTA